MIIMENVHKMYPNGVTALNGIDIEIKHGEFVYIVGPSGAGKSTFVKLLYRESLPSKGSLYIDSTDISQVKEKNVHFLRSKIGVIFQDFRFIIRLTIFDKISLSL